MRLPFSLLGSLARDHRAADALPPDVLLSVQGVSRAIVPQLPEIPRWLLRVLPKSGLAGRHGLGQEEIDEDEEDEDDDEEEEEQEEERVRLRDVSFDVRRGEGVGLLGQASMRSMLMRILLGMVPPTTGRIVYRGLMAPMLRSQLLKLARSEFGRDGVFLAATFLRWPRSLIEERWEEIERFAALEELSDAGARKYQLWSTARLLLSAGLHIDASVYLVDKSTTSDARFAARVVEMLERRRDEGAAIVQAGDFEIADVARLCTEVLWLEDGIIVHRGRALDVAVEVAKKQQEEVDAFSAPVVASLSTEGRVEVGPGGGRVEVDLEVMRSHRDISFALQLSDDEGRETMLADPTRLRSETPGRYHLRISLPPGILRDGNYRVGLLAEISVLGSPTGAPPRELLAFDLVAAGQEDAELDDAGPVFEFLTYEDELEATADDVEWSVSRSSS
jgi:ABC-type polysaccharide/polyol phosphate transport system ATPase subunit